MAITIHVRMVCVGMILLLVSPKVMGAIECPEWWTDMYLYCEWQIPEGTSGSLYTYCTDTFPTLKSYYAGDNTCRVYKLTGDAGVGGGGGGGGVGGGTNAMGGGGIGKR